MIPEGPWRVGSHVGKNLYVDDGSGPEGRGRDVGRMDSPDLAAFVVSAVNAWRVPGNPMRPSTVSTLKLEAAITEAIDHSEYCCSVSCPPGMTHGGQPSGPWACHQACNCEVGKVAARLLRWGSAADTVCEHPTEAEARSHEANTTTVHRWPDGPWLTDDGKVWEGDDQFGALRGEVFELTNEVDRRGRRIDVLRDALCLIVANAGGSRSGVGIARAALDADAEVAAEVERLREALESLSPASADEIGGGHRE